MGCFAAQPRASPRGRAIRGSPSPQLEGPPLRRAPSRPLGTSTRSVGGSASCSHGSRQPKSEGASWHTAWTLLERGGGVFPARPPAPSGVAGQGKSAAAWQGRGRVMRRASAGRHGRHASDAGPEPPTADHVHPAPRATAVAPRTHPAATRHLAPAPPGWPLAGPVRAACPSPRRTSWLSELPCPKRAFLVAVKRVSSVKPRSPFP